MVGPQIRAGRKARGWTQEELARRAGVSRSTISDIERGVDLWRDQDTVQRLMQLLDLEAATMPEDGPRPWRWRGMPGKR
jgi:transcriptional regulator with XRE-family HTH domain